MPRGGVPQRPPGPAHRDINVTEIEIKLPWEGDAGAARAHIEGHGYRAVSPRLLEADQLFDRESKELFRSGQLVRLRASGGMFTVTYKGPADAAAGPYKSREEIEFGVTDAGAFEEVLARLGYQRAFRYEKYRTKFDGGEGIIALDETPIGIFIELEGPKYWIDSAAKSLGFGSGKYLNSSYAALYAAYKAAHPEAPRNMLFVCDSLKLS